MNLKSSVAAVLTAFCISIVSSSAQEEPLRFALLTDLHYSQGGKSVEDIRRCIRDVNALDGLDFVLIGGDLTDFGTDEEIRDVKGMLDSLRTKYYTVAGNHDAKWSESGCNTFKEVFGYERFEFVCKGWRFIGCNCGPDMRMAPALIPQESMEWLRNLPESGKTIFINHYPQDTSVLNYFDVSRELKRIGTRFAIGGHWHRNTVLDYGGVPGVLGRSTLSAGKEPGYTIISIQDDSVTVRERRLCEDGPVLLEPWFAKKLKPVEDKVVYDSEGLPSDYPWMRYDVNGLPSPSGKTVKEVWKYKDNSNIVAGFARRRGKAWYATASGMVRCISLKDGRILWSERFPGKIFSTPAVSGRYLVFGCTGGNVYALNPSNGKLRWKHKVQKSIVASPVIDDGKVFIGASDGCFRALDLRSGKPVWEYHGVEGFVECRPYVDREQVVFGTWGNRLYSLDPADGSLQWIWKCGKPSRMYSPAAVWPVKSGGKVFIAVPDRVLYVLDARTGVEIKTFEKSCRESVGISPDGGKVYCKSMFHKISSIDAASLEMDWSVETGAGYDISPTSISRVREEVLMPTDKGNLLSFAASDGRLLWMHKISVALLNPLEAWADGDGEYILVSSMDGTVTLLRINQL